MKIGKLTGRQRLLTLIGIMATTVMVSDGVGLWLEYRHDLTSNKYFLQEVVDNQVAIITAMGQFDAEYSVSDDQGGPIGATLRQFANAQSQYLHLEGRISSLALMKLEKIPAVIILREREKIVVSNHFALGGQSIDMPGWLNKAVKRASTEAVSGHHTMIIENNDAEILTSFETVKIAGDKFAVIASVDLRDIWLPFVDTAIKSLSVAFILIVLGAVGFLQLINPLIRALEIQFRKSQTLAEELGMLVEQAPTAVIVTDEYGKIQRFNKEAENLFDWRADEIIEGNVSLLVPKVHQTQHDGYLAHYRKTGESQIVGSGRETKAQRRDGTEVPIFIIVSRVELSTSEVRMVAFVRDITEQKAVEHALEEARDRAEEASRAKASFLANMSHEIRTPMNAIIGFLKIVLERAKLSPELSGHLKTVHNSAQQLLVIINDILDITKLESGKLELENVCFHLENMVTEVLQTLHLKAEEKSLTLDSQIDPDSPYCYRGDPTRLRQVLVNIIGNAIKFTESGGVIMTVNLTEAGFVHFTIEDTGVGIPADRLESIFAPFTQADESTTRRYGGTGLGTTISRQIVELMGGKIWAESEEGVGSAFHFTIQLPGVGCTPDCAHFGETTQEIGTTSPRLFRVLVAEDNLQNVELIRIRLEEQGHTLAIVENGQQAVDVWQQGDFDLILMDVMMPVMNGHEATREIRKLEAESGKHIAIIALTASVTAEDQMLSKDAGMDEVVGKPIDLPTLFITMERVVPEGLGEVNDQPIVVQPTRAISFSAIEKVADISRGVRIWHDSEAYLRNLRSFTAEHKEDAGILKSMLEEGEISAAKALAHSLKGVAGNLALTKVAQISTELDVALKAGKQDHAFGLVADLNVALQNADSAIELLSLPTPELSGPVQDFDLEKVVKLSQQLLKEFDKDEVEQIKPVLEELGRYLSPDQLEVVQGYVDNFDFDEAKKAVTKLVKGLTQMED
ncbi:MAG: response regulator [Candidatus Thiodiazotropha sp. (ex Lucinoma kastoroae)]|nr:response regulator [Candidatus Thiodiazotropha sp. (ex Lucinoma kastoroae)]